MTLLTSRSVDAGVLTFAETSPNYEAPASTRNSVNIYQVTVKATDSDDQPASGHG